MNSNMDVFFVLDFDRTIGDTDKFHHVLESVIERETKISRAELNEARHKAEGRGESFDTVGYVREILSAEEGQDWLVIERLFIKEAQRQDMLEPYAHLLLDTLERQRIPYGILTYGGAAWQLAKIEAGNLLDVPHLVTHIQEKGTILSGWKKGDVFIIPPALTKDFKPLTVSSIVFLDDKVVSFMNIPSGMRGVRVRTGTPLLSQDGELPSGVEDVEGLHGAIRLLFPKVLETIVDKA